MSIPKVKEQLKAALRKYAGVVKYTIVCDIIQPKNCIIIGLASEYVPNPLTVVSRLTGPCIRQMALDK